MQNQPSNQIVLVPTSLGVVHLSSNRELTAWKNNLAKDTNSWCFPYNEAHMPQNCLRDNLQQKVAEQHSQGAALDSRGYVYASINGKCGTH